MKAKESFIARFTWSAAQTIVAGLLAVSLVQSATAAGLTHRYSFTSDATDSVGGANGTVVGNVTFSNSAAVFPNLANNYIELPPGIVSNYSVVTFEFWANVGANGNWAETYAFGNQNAAGQGANLLMFTPHSGNGDFRMSYSQADPGFNDEYVVTGPGTLDGRGQMQIVCVYDTVNSVMSLYTNGFLCSSTPNRALGPFFQLTNIYNINSWLGRSMYSADAPYNGTIDEFRIYDTVRNAFDIMIDNAAGPDLLVPSAGALQTVAISATNMNAVTVQPAKVLANFANIQNVPVTTVSSNWNSSNPSIISVDPLTGALTSGANSGSSVISAVYNSITGSTTVSVTAVVTNLALNAPSQIVAASARKLAVIAKYSDGSSSDITGASTYSSSNTNVATVVATPTGEKIAGWTNGTTTITATFQAFQATATVNVVPLAMTHHWAFDDDGASTNVVDSIGGANGAIWGGSFLNGSQAAVDGVSGYVQFPPDLFTNYGSVTFETWVTDLGTLSWGRIWDFGNSISNGTATAGTRYMFLALPTGGGTMAGSYTITGGGAGEQFLTMAGRPPANVPLHIVWTSEGATHQGRLYVDGLLVATNANMTLTPEDVGSTTNNWLGRSQYSSDHYFIGAYDDFRIYNGALDPFSIAVDTAAGPNVITNNAGACSSILLTLNSPVNEGDSQQVSLTGQFANVGTVPLTTLSQITYTSSNTRVATINALGMVTAVGPGTATITATGFGQTSQATIVVNAVPITLTHRWNFNDAPGSTTLLDSIGNGSGQIIGNVTFDGSQGTFDGTNCYVLLPQDLFTTYNSITLEAWFTDTGSGTWARLFDLGNNNSHYMFLDAVGPGNNMRAAFNAGGGEGANVVNYGARPALNTQHHVVFTQDALSHTAKLYVDGALVVQNFNFTLRPKDIGTSLNNYIGKSQYPDPYYVGRINDMRTWQGAISAQQVMIDYAAGPDNAVLNPGAPQTTVLATNMAAGTVQQARALVNFSGVNNVNLTSLATNWTSSNPSVAKVDSRGVITAVGAGSTTIAATYGTVGSVTINVAAAVPPVLAHRYSFTADATDSVGGANGTISGTAHVAAGKVVLDGVTNSYVSLPGGLVSGMADVTIETWFTYPLTNITDSRVWDFGDSNWTNYAGYIANPDTRFRWNFGTAQASVIMTGASGASYGTNDVHAVWVLSSANRTAKLYIDGLWKETFTLPGPMNAFSNAMFFLGKAVTTNAPPGNFIGAIDEFRIWNGALDQFQVAANHAAGPDNPVIAPGAPISLAMVLNDPTMVVGTKQRARVTANIASASNLDLTAYPGLVFSSSNPGVVAVNTDDQLVGVAPGTTTVTVAYGGQTATQSVTVVAKQLKLAHRYSFNTDAKDSVGKADARTYGLARLSGGGVVLNGTRYPQTYVELPRDIIAGYDAMTIETWVSVGANGGTWERLWDLGDHANGGGRDYIYYSPYSGAGGNPGRLGLSANSALIGEVDVDCAPLRGRYVHIACVVDSVAGTMTVYTNGVIVSTYSGPSPVALPLLNNVYSFLGRSQFNDNWFDGTIDEFRIYYGAMTQGQVTSSFNGGANPDVLGATISGSNVVLHWADSLITAGWKPQSKALLTDATWQPVAGTPTLANGIWTQTVPITGQSSFFRLSP